MARKKIVTDESSPVGGDSVLTDILVDSLNKQLGDVAFILGKNDSNSDVKEWISTGSTVLDTIISNSAEGGGVPVGKLTEIVGEEATGKSLLSYMILKDCQDKGGIPVSFDKKQSNFSARYNKIAPLSNTRRPVDLCAGRFCRESIFRN